MKKSNIIYLLIVVIISFAGCAKDGETGPKGDKGDTGATGAQGPGATTFSYTVTAWGTVPTILKLTNADGLNIASSDVVLSYLRTGSDWIPLPFINPTIHYRVFFHQDYYVIDVQNSDGTPTSPSSLFSVPRSIKIVVIPARIANPNVNVNNYDEVKAAYNLKD